jgi:hypothetical protein
MEQNPKRNHHFVPRCLLKNWCDAKERLWQFDAKENRSSEEYRKDAGMERDLYTTRAESDFPDYETVENELAKVENAAAPVLEHFRNHKKGLAPSTVRKFFLFVSLQYMRTPGMLERLRALCDPHEEKRKRLASLVAKLKETLGGDAYPSAFIDEVVPKAAELAGKFMSPKDALLQAAMAQVQMVADEVAALPWGFLDVPDAEPDLILSDNPVLLNDGGPDGTPVKPLGFSNPHLQIMLPISPRMLASGGYGVTGAGGCLMPGAVEVLNDLSCKFASRYVFATHDSAHTLARAVALLSAGPKVRLAPVISKDGRLGFRQEFW